MSGSMLSSMPGQPTPRRKVGNRGPAAAAGNRSAILTAARRLFADYGYRVPLNSIARRAGVGQAVLYRHFPTRLALALEVFADNFAALEEVARSSSGPYAFDTLWHRLIDYTLESTAFIEVVLAHREDRDEQAGQELNGPRLDALLEAPLASAQRAGLVNLGWTAGDVKLLLQMIHGVIVAHPENPRQAVARAVELVDARLAAVLQAD